MKKILSLMTIALLLIPAIAAAQDADGSADTVISPNPVSTKPLKITTLAILGNGIAVSPSDAMDFKMVKIGIGTVRAELLAETTSLTVGVMLLDEDRYKLKDVVIADGKASGNVYSTDDSGTGTMVGSFGVASVMKGNLEVWAGTLTISGATYHLYVMQAHRQVKPVELKEKVADYCQNNPDDTNCRDKIGDYCQNNPDEERCQKLFMAHCVQGSNLDDSRCREFMNRYCEANPEIEDCGVFAYQRSRQYCEENPGSNLCVKINAEIVEFCSVEPNHEKCRDFCAKYPERCREVVKSLAEFCVNNENHERCRAYCSENPAACKTVAESVVSVCLREPDRAECVSYCKEHPVECGKVAAELARFCIGNAAHEKCQDFCREYPNACRKVADAIDTFCANRPTAAGCEEWCKKYPARCATSAQKPAITDVSQLATGAIATNTKAVATNTSTAGG
jgi:hypothetical protein